MIRTSDLNYCAILLALGLGRIAGASAPDGGRLITFEQEPLSALLQAAQR